MTNEAKERAIRWLTEEVRSLRMAPTVNGCEPDNWAEQLEVMETCLKAVRDHFPGKTKMVPLTLEQLREMDGQPVWVEFEDRSGGLWGIVHISVFEQIVFPDGLHCTIGQPYYGKIYKAYAYPPAHIDMEAWEKPCGMCGGKTTLYQHTNTTKLFMNTFGEAATLVTECMACPPYADCCMKGISANSAFKINFCPECGRPLTEEARAELEKRLRR